MQHLWRRPQAARGADFFISVHHDSTQARFQSTWTHEGAEQRYSDRFQGFSLFVSRENRFWRDALRCASMIGAALVRAGFKPSLYHADPVLGENRLFADKANGVHYFDHLAVLRHASSPAVLFEAGLIVNRDEELLMRDAVVQKRIAESVARGTSECLNQ
jgi:N-acetylmuramoyl-L-alanine amidase